MEWRRLCQYFDNRYRLPKPQKTEKRSTEIKMTNRELYNFDYFTIDHYAEIIRLTKELGYEFILHKTPFVADRRDVIWRHDVEFSLDQALKMAKIEAEQGVFTTYFFQMHSGYYNIFNKYFTQIFHEIKSLGHHIGLHFDSHYFGISNEEELNYFIRLDREYFEKVLHVELDTFSFHNTTPFTLGCKEYEYGGLINVYASFFKEHYEYCADSTGIWRYEVLDEKLRDPKTRHIQVLIHDAMWSDTVLSPRKRIHTCIQQEAERMKALYDQVTRWGAKNIDD